MNEKLNDIANETEEIKFDLEKTNNACKTLIDALLYNHEEFYDERFYLSSTAEIIVEKININIEKLENMISKIFELKQ